MAGIDYGSIILKNGKRYKADELYPKIDELGIVFYKLCVEDANGDNYYWFGNEKYVEHIVFKGININTKMLIKDRVCEAEIFHNNDRYNILFGYGIDNDLKVWNKIKYDYLGKKGARKVDNWLGQKGVWKGTQVG